MLVGKEINLYHYSLIITLIVLGLLLTSCANEPNPNTNETTSSHWDFDHQLQYKQTQLADDLYQLEAMQNNSVGFERLATFLLRKSYNLCGHYHYKIEMIQGIEGFDDKRAMPNYIFPSLIAKIEC